MGLVWSKMSRKMSELHNNSHPVKHFSTAENEFFEAGTAMLNLMQALSNTDMETVRHCRRIAKDAAERGIRELENGMRSLGE